MDKFYKTKKLFICIIVIIALLLSISCTKKEEEQESNKEKIPQQLLNIVDNSERVIEEIEKLQEGIEDPDKLEDPEQEKNGQENEKSQEEQKKQDGEEEQQNGGEEEQKSGSQSESDQADKEKEQSKEENGEETTYSDKIKKIWEDIMKIVTETHTSWNSIEFKSGKDGITEEEINKLEESLNELTIFVDEKDDMKAISLANEVILSISDILAHYDGNIDAEINKIKYFARMTLIYGQLGDWASADKAIKESFPVFSTLAQKINLEEKDKEKLSKLEHSIVDMEKVIKDENKELLKIKRDIIVENVDTIKEVAK